MIERMLWVPAFAGTAKKFAVLVHILSRDQEPGYFALFRISIRTLARFGGSVLLKPTREVNAKRPHSLAGRSRHVALTSHAI